MPLLKLVDALRIGYEVEQQFKVGNWVVRKTNQEDERLPFRTGRVFKIKGFINGHYLDNEEFRHDSEALRYATSEEIKAEIERQLWKSIGREVGELKENDLVIYENKYFRLFKNMGCEIYGFHMDPVYASKLYGNGNLKVFTQLNHSSHLKVWKKDELSRRLCQYCIQANRSDTQRLSSCQRD